MKNTRKVGKRLIAGKMRTIYRGPNGGKYYIRGGNKIYL